MQKTPTNYARCGKGPWKDKWKYSGMLCIFFTFLGNSIPHIALQRKAGEKPKESPSSEVFEGLIIVFKREKCDSSKIDFRVQILITVLLVCMDG